LIWDLFWSNNWPKASYCDPQYTGRRPSILLSCSWPGPAALKINKLTSAAGQLGLDQAHLTSFAGQMSGLILAEGQNKLVQAKSESKLAFGQLALFKRACSDQLRWSEQASLLLQAGLWPAQYLVKSLLNQQKIHPRDGLRPSRGWIFC